VHSDVGGSYPEAQSGLSKITLEWMLCEAVSRDLIVDKVKADRVLGRIPPPPPFAPPDVRAELHKSLKRGWWLLEFLPHRYYDAISRKVRWRIPLGARRFIPPGSVLHETVSEKLHDDPNYQPTNLPEKASVEPRNACVFS
jgi:hypothetical protein